MFVLRSFWLRLIPQPTADVRNVGLTRDSFSFLEGVSGTKDKVEERRWRGRSSNFMGFSGL